MTSEAHDSLTGSARATPTAEGIDGGIVAVALALIAADGESARATIESKARPWFMRFIQTRLKKRAARGKASLAEGEPAARTRAIRRVALGAAMSGAAAASISTAATLVTAQTEGIAGLVALPIAGLATGADLALRTLLHAHITWDLAQSYGVTFDLENDDDMWRLYSLAYGTLKHAEKSDDAGGNLLDRVLDIEPIEASEKIGHKLLGESVVRNFLPILGIGFAAISNYRKTVRLGDTLREYMRYQRAIGDALRASERGCANYRGLLLEGIWFLFTADGRLLPEEAAILAQELTMLPLLERAAVRRRFVDDESEWLERLAREVPAEQAKSIFRTLQIAAAADKQVGVPERRILRSVARVLDLAFDAADLEKMVAEFVRSGVLQDGATHAETRPAADSA